MRVVFLGECLQEVNDGALAHERSLLILKWFQLWPDDEKASFLLKMIALCSLKEKRRILDEIHRQIPQKHVDFTRYLPRVLSLYVLSFLDPRSLCRTAQVCWNWKYLSESNEIWMKKCLKLGWNLPNAFAAIEHGAYKKLYINNMHYLRIVGPVQIAAARQAVRLAIEEERKAQEAQQALERDKQKLATKRAAQREAQRVAEQKTARSLPWLGPSPRPQETRRFNCLENEDLLLKRSSQLTSRSAENFRSTDNVVLPRSRPRSAAGRHPTAQPMPPPQRKASTVAMAVTERLFKDARQRQKSPTRRRVDAPAPILDIIRDVDSICREEQRRRLSQRRSPKFGALQPPEAASTITARDSFVIGPVPRSGRREVPFRHPSTASPGLISQLTSEMIQTLPPPPRYIPEQAKTAAQTEPPPKASPRNPCMKPPKYTVEPIQARQVAGTTNERPPPVENGRESLRNSLRLLLKDVPTQ
ncbi:A Receptor for Ubiquitination Targets [Sparganum proliferum]